MKLEYRFGQVYYSDLHPGDLISTSRGDYVTIKEDDIDENGYLKQNTYLSSNLIMKDKMVHTYVSDGTNCEKANFTVDTQYEKEKLPILKEENGKFYVATEGIDQFEEHYAYWLPISKELYLFLKNKGAK